MWQMKCAITVQCKSADNDVQNVNAALELQERMQNSHNSSVLHAVVSGA